MRLGLNLGYWAGRSEAVAQRNLVRYAEQLGFDSCWVAEAYGSDAASILGSLAAVTSRIGLGSAVFQLPARTPAMTAMTAATLDVLSEGRFRLGLGVSGPQVSEGWHGVRFDHPLARTDEYVQVLRLALARERVEFVGRHLQLPLPDGPGKALRLGIQPVQQRLPIYVAAVGPRNLELTGRIADGWLGLFFAPERADLALDPLTRGRLAAAPDAVEPLAGFDVCVGVPVSVDDDVAVAADQVRAHYALYIGGMGSRDKNFYHATATRLGFGEAADRVQELFLAGRQREAAREVPLDLIDATALIGPPARLTSRLTAFASAGVTTLAVSPFPTTPGAQAPLLDAVVSAARTASVLTVTEQT